MKGKELQRVKVALLKELDITLQRCCHQRLDDVMTDMRTHYADIKPTSSPDEVFSIFIKTGVLKSILAAPITRLRESLERLQMGNFGLCISCGREVSAEYLVKNPTATHCEKCDNDSQKSVSSAHKK